MALWLYAVRIGVRAPYLLPDGDAGIHTIVQDPVTGIPFDIGIYKGQFREKIAVSVAYGAAVVDPSNMALLLG